MPRQLKTQCRGTFRAGEDGYELVSYIPLRTVPSILVFHILCHRCWFSTYWIYTYSAILTAGFLRTGYCFLRTVPLLQFSMWNAGTHQQVWRPTWVSPPHSQVSLDHQIHQFQAWLGAYKSIVDSPFISLHTYICLPLPRQDPIYSLWIICAVSFDELGLTDNIIIILYNIFIACEE